MTKLGECQELIDNTSHSWTTVGSVKGRRFVSKTNTSTYLFVTAFGETHFPPNAYGGCWSSTYIDSTTAYDLLFDASQCVMFNRLRYLNRYVRGCL